MKTSCRTPLLLMPCLLIAVALPTHAQTKMFKCIIDGRTVYQQTGCPVGLRADDVKSIAETAAAYRPPASAAARASASAATLPASAGGNPQTQAKTSDTRREIQR